jgi:hypothetical protein
MDHGAMLIVETCTLAVPSDFGQAQRIHTCFAELVRLQSSAVGS